VRKLNAAEEQQRGQAGKAEQQISHFFSFHIFMQCSLHERRPFSKREKAALTRAALLDKNNKGLFQKKRASTAVRVAKLSSCTASGDVSRRAKVGHKKEHGGDSIKIKTIKNPCLLLRARVL
jgi:hypothetical protein